MRNSTGVRRDERDRSRSAGPTLPSYGPNEYPPDAERGDVTHAGVGSVRPQEHPASGVRGYLGRMPTSIEAWWPRLSQETRDWLVAHNGDEVTPTVMAEINRAGGLVSTDAWGAGHDTPQGAYLPDDVVDWIEAVANGEVPPR